MLQITFSLAPSVIQLVLIEQCVYHRDSLTTRDIVLCLFNSYVIENENRSVTSSLMIFHISVSH